MALRRIALVLILAGASLGCPRRGGDADEPIALVVDSPPPPPRPERALLRRGHIWVRGSWQMRGGRWQWRGGRFEPERAGLVWIGGHWLLRGDRYHWIEGRWRASRDRR